MSSGLHCTCLFLIFIINENEKKSNLKCARRHYYYCYYSRQLRNFKLNIIFFFFENRYVFDETIVCTKTWRYENLTTIKTRTTMIMLHVPTS